MWVKAFRYFGWKKFQCGTRRCLCRVFLPLAPAPQSGRAAPAPGEWALCWAAFNEAPANADTRPWRDNVDEKGHCPG